MSERLEEIKKLWNENNDVPNDPTDYEWLIQQAERVEELERENKSLKQISYTQLKNRVGSERSWFAHQTDLIEQNQHYKEIIQDAFFATTYPDEEYAINKVHEILDKALKGEINAELKP